MLRSEWAPSSWIKSCTACSTFSFPSLFWLIKQKKRLHYTLITLHQTLHNTLTTHSKHGKCHKSLNSQYRCLYTDRRCLLIIRLCASHNFLFLNNQTCCLDTFVTKASFYRFFPHQTQSKCDGNVRIKSWRTLFTQGPVLDVPKSLVHRLRRWAV